MNRYLTYKGVTKTLTEWSKIICIPEATLRARIDKNNWKIEKALTTPVRDIRTRIGNRYGRLVVTDVLGHHKNGSVKYLFKCDCGKECSPYIANVLKGKTVSCGCYHLESITRHNLYGSKIYGVWAAMIQRCSNQNNVAFKNYGERGISVCKKWKKFDGFYADMKEAPKGMWLERIDNSKGYSRSNCKWATYIEQQNNKRTSRKITYKNTTKTLSEWARLYKISPYTLTARLRRGWSIKKALTQPLIIK